MLATMPVAAGAWTPAEVVLRRPATEHRWQRFGPVRGPARDVLSRRSDKWPQPGNGLVRTRLAFPITHCWPADTRHIGSSPDLSIRHGVADVSRRESGSTSWQREDGHVRFSGAPPPPPKLHRSGATLGAGVVVAVLGAPFSVRSAVVCPHP